ncbi:hypothetical protein JGS22_019705 [Streptomyces sp. P38-E01]|uniref:Uncharacterized protein n=1 Tax=Streptomyces tardus TaxID=2780544 RepID=A0A949JJ40_9ACTN|nr:hypothetical protein [Streptomyces tardus]MBU7599788.1 hypothetical protein [Streptomyces tardus]
MSPILDVSDDVRAEIGEEEVTRLLAGETAPGSYDCTSCRTPGDTGRERTSTVLFIGDETAVLAFAHATCVPSQIVRVSEEQIQGAVRTITGDSADAPGSPGEQAVLKVTCGQVLVGDQLRAAIVVEPSAAIVRPGSTGTQDEFLTLLLEHGFSTLGDIDRMPAAIPGWSVLMAAGQLHAVLQPGPEGTPTESWWQAHQPLPVTDEWRSTANRNSTVLVYATPTGWVGDQPREDLMRQALEKAAANGSLVAAAMPLAGT